MLSETELPGFPIPENSTAACIRCDAPIVPDPPAGWSGYTEQEFEKWEDSLPVKLGTTDETFPDPLGFTTAHDANCPYVKLPPIVMWFENEERAAHIHRKLWEAWQP
ncbi:hypothetical protein [Streptomyces sp. CRN 30]|uniref:hypothetical protein n=1 Tax=Streptomyces sp. CRN 30 TaxID=3075613 RepID=UPI002A8077A8|nr:hypothetical protein [Streptomyces sp. CRN 30]